MRVFVLRLLVLSLALLATVPATAAARSSLDRSFGDAGRVVRDRPTITAGGFREMAVAPDGTIYGRFDGALLAFRPNGETETGFAAAGLLSPELGSTVPLGDLAVDSQGRLILASLDRAPMRPTEPWGITETSVRVARALPSGQLDPSFGSGGSVTTDFGLSPAMTPPFARAGVVIYSLRAAIDQLDRVLVAGEHITSMSPGKYGPGLESDGFAARLGTDGTLDPSFGNGGVASGFSTPSFFAPLGVGPLGSLSLVDQGNAERESAVVHFDPSGRLGGGFGRGGYRVVPSGEVPDFFVDGRGRLVFALDAYEGSEVSFRRLLPDGRLDRGFGRRGVLRLDLEAGYSVALADDRTTGGFFVTSAWKRTGKSASAGAWIGFQLLHVNARGRIDRGYGRIRSGFGRNTKAVPTSIAVDQLGQPLVAGTIRSPLLPHHQGMAMARYRPAG